MTYKCRPGIVRIKICGDYMLVPTRAASEKCPLVMRLNLLSAALWEELEKGHDGSIIVLTIQKLGRRTEEQARNKVADIVEELYQKGFLIKADEED